MAVGSGRAHIVFYVRWRFVQLHLSLLLVVSHMVLCVPPEEHCYLFTCAWVLHSIESVLRGSLSSSLRYTCRQLSTSRPGIGPHVDGICQSGA